MKNKIIYHKVLPKGEFRTYYKKPSFKVVHSKQVHSAALAPYQGEPLNETEVDGTAFKYADLESDKVAVAVTTADCMPVIFLGEEKGVFLHAGWRGLAGGILTNPLVKEIKPFYAFIGPSIELESFEVQADFKQHFQEEEFFHHIGGKLCYDLHAKAAKDIHLAYPGINLEISGQCTFKNQKFHSWRRDKAKQRNWNIFCLNFCLH